MRIVALYHPKSEHGGKVEDFAAEYARFHDYKIKLLSLETVEGAEAAQLYDITQYPAFLVIADNGSLQKAWQGEPLPSSGELDAYVVQAR